MSESETEADAEGEETEEVRDPTGEQTAKRTEQLRSCQRCGREQGLVGKYDIYLCRQCFREIARGMGFKKYS
ncbi:MULTISPECIES: 30S ribosomal protein S14 [Halorientalis]|jgi:small subunit ribosomal protein S14|uniref:Small ribosomal subunit protein uS14 n=3 Tax=Halorientalis TaxID=1073987 RepID=A0A1G7I4M2_9EURY|nr:MULTISPECIES: 30S ribosomal protein S14 [Halorientalis]RXK51796.1 30S ribosomal protein S14 [Halorientalis pallida]SDF07655.1 small subunit ribosomal protein S14 [Halorientalis regularis]SEN05903.1 small subunit ribosomal protein S14 [Halorientalis persicus]